MKCGHDKAKEDIKKCVENQFRFAGEQYDQLTGQYYLRARFYNPVIGQFTREDTYYGDGLNLYAYCDNNPVRYVDPSGYGKQDPNQKQRKRKESDWDRFRKENKSKYTREEMSAAYQKSEQTIKLLDGTTVRKDGVDKNNSKKVRIIKPNTPTGRKAAEERAKLMKKQGAKKKGTKKQGAK